MMLNNQLPPQKHPQHQHHQQQRFRNDIICPNDFPSLRKQLQLPPLPPLPLAPLPPVTNMIKDRGLSLPHHHHVPSYANKGIIYDSNSTLYSISGTLDKKHCFQHHTNMNGMSHTLHNPQHQQYQHQTLMNLNLNHNENNKHNLDQHNPLSSSCLSSCSTSASTLQRPSSVFWEMHMQDAIRYAQHKRMEKLRQRRRRATCAVCFVLCLVVFVLGIVGLTYWMSLASSHQKSDNHTKLIVLGEFRITNRPFSESLTSRSYHEFQTLASEVTRSIDDMFLNSYLARVYNSTEITAFSKSDPSGVIAHCQIVLNIAMITAAQEVGLTMVKALEQGHGTLPSGSLKVDIRTIKFTAISATLPPPPSIIITNKNPVESKKEQEKTTEDKTESSSSASTSSTPTEIKESVTRASTTTGTGASWSNWSQWSPCRGINRRCDPGRIHSRIRKCISENGEVVNSDYCRMNNGEQQELEIRDCRCSVEDEISNTSRVNKTVVDEVASPSSSSFTPFNSKYSPSYTTGSRKNEANGSNNITDAITGTAGVDEVSHSANIESDKPCTNCKENEICLLQVKANVPFCAKIKDTGDPRGCGGWCSGHKELCRYVGAGTYQCVDDSECLEGEWQCANGLCIPESRRCDGHFNCFDMSDENQCESLCSPDKSSCQCKEDEFHCGNKTSCLPISRKCNGIIDCWDGEDELNCTKICSDNQYACSTGGQCIPLDNFCDSHPHCDDGSDEPDGCNVSSRGCLSNERQCKNGRCVSSSQVCDGINNCGKDDNTDEIDCRSPIILAINSSKSHQTNQTHHEESRHSTINNRQQHLQQHSQQHSRSQSDSHFTNTRVSPLAPTRAAQDLVGKRTTSAASAVSFMFSPVVTPAMTQTNSQSALTSTKANRRMSRDVRIDLTRTAE